MRKTSGYIFSILLLCMNLFQGEAQDKLPDSVLIPLKIRAGLDLAGPVLYFTNKDKLSLEGFISADINEKIGIFLGYGHASYKYSQYNYSYQSNGIFFRGGVDFNLLKPQTNMGKYQAGIGIHYGLSMFKSQTPYVKYVNYWGTTTTMIPEKNGTGHFLEITPGFRAEIFNNFSIGWTVCLRRLIYPGAKADLRPIYIPGYGEGGNQTSFAINYFITINFPYKKIKVAAKKEKPEEPEDTEQPAQTNPSSGQFR